jgi:hypothetical protein
MRTAIPKHTKPAQALIPNGVDIFTASPDIFVVVVVVTVVEVMLVLL